MVWETEKPNASGNSAVNFFMTDDFPEPDGPHRTRGLVDTGAMVDAFRIAARFKRDMSAESGKIALVRSNFTRCTDGFTWQTKLEIAPD